MPTNVTDGSQTAVIGTEHTLATDTTNKTYVLVVDTGAMVAGDTLILRIYTIVRSAGTERVAYTEFYRDAQYEPQKYSVPVPADISFKATLQQTAGTGRAFPWKVLSL